MPYSMEFRQALAAAHHACWSSAEVAEAFSCSESWVRRLIQTERETGSLACTPPKLPNNNKLDETEMKKLAKLVAARPDIQLKELAAALGNKVSVPTIHRATKRLGLTRKKRPFTPPSSSVRT